jgi:hypothetical protein
VGYLNVLFSVPEGQVRAIRADSSRLLHPASLITVGHVWWLSEEAEPLRDLIGEVLDGGKPLSPAYRHPLRPPIYHDPHQVHDLAERLARGWQRPYAAEYRADGASLVRVEFEKVLELFLRASGQSECVVSVLLPPTDVEGYDWVKMPFAVLPAGGVPGAGSLARAPRRSLSTWTRWPVVGTVAGLGILGAVGLCVWRYRRLTFGCGGPRRPRDS